MIGADSLAAAEAMRGLLAKITEAEKQFETKRITALQEETAKCPPRLLRTVTVPPTIPIIDITQYELHEEIGSGGQGRVVRCTQGNRVFAYKSLDVKRESIRMHNEALLAAGAIGTHPNICTLHGASIETRGDATVLGLLFEFIEEHTLLYRIQSTSEERFHFSVAAHLARQIAHTLIHLHSRGVLLRDWSPKNVLVAQDGTVTLIDLGMACLLSSPHERRFDICGNRFYHTPESLSGEGTGFASDWWCFGVMLSEMLCGRPPFMHEDDRILRHRIRNRPPEMPAFLTPTTTDLITKLLDKNELTRLQGVAVLEHPFFLHPVEHNLSAKEEEDVYEGDEFNDF